MQTREQIQALADALGAAATKPARVVLFGSYARGDATEKSDVDFLVIEKKIANRNDEYVELWNVIGARQVDLLLMQEDEYQKRTDWIGSLPYRVNREGQVLHG